MNLRKTFAGKKILITGNTGFKGAWLSLSLKYLGAKVYGISDNTRTSPNLFNSLGLKKKIVNKNINLKNFNQLKKNINLIKPDYIFHLAAEALVKRSYANPKNTWETNTLGTINILEILRNYKYKTISVFITSDKVYKNLEIKRGYHENDKLGDTDPYSASKSSADIAIQSYYHSYFKKKNNIRISIARAGNVIGGGDWSEGRLIPDCVKCWQNKKKLIIRSPKSTRPWQHVFDVINGYLILAEQLSLNVKHNGHAYNFGPSNIGSRSTVLDVIKHFIKYWPKAKFYVEKKIRFKEANLLKLDSKKSLKNLKWKTKYNQKQALDYTAKWYKEFYRKKSNIYNFSLNQIKNFFNE